jgi:hypothetical protein
MKKVLEISKWDLQTTHNKQKYHMTNVPVSSDDNFNILLNKHNELVRNFNSLLDYMGIDT